MACDNGRLLI